MRHAETDVLVLGAGLAGLSAAWSALTLSSHTRTPLRVAMAWSGRGPSGSSFGNRNDGWGLLAPDGDEDRERFVARAIRIAPPGSIDPKLVRILAEEAGDRRRELETLAIHPQERTSRACFAPELRAFVYRDARAVFRALADKIASCGGVLLEDVEAIHLISMDNAVRGALFVDSAGEPVLCAARAVVCALGGPAPLLPRHVAGGSNSGASPSLLARAGARLTNMPYLQWMWHDVDSGRFVRIDRLAWGTTQPDTSALPSVDPELIQARGEHLPRSYDLPDEALDLVLGRLAFAEPTETVSVRGNDGVILHISPHAHASNGGARIDEHGRTTVDGLWACGECAGGMHGANRLGGAMIAACLVFGRRAGMDAARRAAETESPDSARLQEEATAWMADAKRSTEQYDPRLDPDRAARALFLRHNEDARTMLQELGASSLPDPTAEDDLLEQLVVRLAEARILEAATRSAWGNTRPTR